MLIILILTIFSLEIHININEYVKHILEILYKLDFNLIYLFITSLLRSNNLHSNKSYHIALALLANEES